MPPIWIHDSIVAVLDGAVVGLWAPTNGGARRFGHKEIDRFLGEGNVGRCFILREIEGCVRK